MRPTKMRECVEPAWLEVIDEVARRELGRDDRTGDALAAEVKRLSEIYTRRERLRDGPRSPGALAARLRFFLPRDLAKARGPIDELALAPRDTIRILDVGAGLGATSLGALSALPAKRAEIVAVDDDARALSLLSLLTAAAALRGLIPETTVTSRKLDLAKLGIETAAQAPREAGERGFGGAFDLVLAGFVLNELPLEGRVELLLSLSRFLAPGGALVVLEPALRDTSRALHAVRDALVARDAPPYVAAPCLRLGTCPMLATERDWCHEDLPLSLPAPLIPTARAAELRYEGLSYAYLTLRNEPGALHGAGARGVPLRVVSDVLVSKGKREIFGCGVPGRVRLVRLDRHESAANAAFGAAGRGDVLDVAPLEVDDRGRAKIEGETSVTALATLAARAPGP